MDIASALASRQIGSLRVVAGVQLVGAHDPGRGRAPDEHGAADATRPRSPSSALLGLIGAGAYLAYFTGLRVGPIAVVSGVVAAYGGLTVVLSVVLRGETLTTLQAVGASIATIGVILTGIAFEGHWRSTRLAGPGVIFSIVALVLFAMMAITTDVAIGYADWLQVLLVSRVVNATLGHRRRRHRRVARGATGARREPAIRPAHGRRRPVADGSWRSSSWPGCSTSPGWRSFAFGISRRPRPGSSDWPRRSGRRSRSSSRWRSSASASSRSSGSG